MLRSILLQTITSESRLEKAFKNCQSKNQRRSQYLEFKRMRKGQIFHLLSKFDISNSVEMLSRLSIYEKAYIDKNKCSGDFETQLELGSTVCVQIRLLIAYKQFSTAQDLLHNYFKQKNFFLQNLNNIANLKQLEDLQEREKANHIRLISGKIKLISSLANLTHELIRNAIDMIDIMVKHVEKIYGNDSLELGNIYFYTANYLNFLNQTSKALACFLKSAKLRKEKGGTAYYNGGVLLFKAARYRRSLQFFIKALQLVSNENNVENNKMIPEMHESLALVYEKFGNTKQMMQNFEKALFFHKKNGNKARANQIMKFFIIFKRESEKQSSEQIKTVQFSKQKKQKKPITALNSKNVQKYLRAEQVDEQDRNKIREWHEGFRQVKTNYIQTLIKKQPKELEILLGNNNSKQHVQQIPEYMIKNQTNLEEGVNIDITFMKSLNYNQVGYLNQLNRLLSQCRERAAIYDIVENSNFYQNVNNTIRSKFYKLNPKLVRPSDLQQRILLLEKVEELAEQEKQEELIEIPNREKLKKKPQTPKLDFSKLKYFK